MQTFIWRHYQFDLPDDWEMLQFSRNPELGSCVFADRRQFRFELNWRAVQGTPDFDRMLHDYQARLEEDGLQGVRRLEHQRWHGVRGEAGHSLTTRYGRYIAEDRSLIELVFIWPKEWDSALEKRILDSFRLIVPEEGLVRWRAYGMDLRVSAGHELWKADVPPTSAELLFTAQKGYRSQRFSRFAMAEEWLTLSPGDWLLTRIPRGFRIDQQTRHLRDGHEIFSVRGLRSLPTLKNMFLGRREIKASAWICPEDKRLYSLVLVSTDRVVEAESRISLRCCSHMEVNP